MTFLEASSAPGVRRCGRRPGEVVMQPAVGVLDLNLWQLLHPQNPSMS